MAKFKQGGKGKVWGAGQESRRGTVSQTAGGNESSQWLAAGAGSMGQHRG